MALADDVRALRDRTLEKLIIAHDYFEASRIAWGIVLDEIKSGRSFSHQSSMTGTKITETVLAANAPGYVARQLAESTFQQVIAVFESFIFDLIRLWLTAYPRSLKKKMVEFEAILDAPDKEAIALLVIGKEVNEILYKRPAEWFAYLEERIGIGCPTGDEVEQFTEAKAARDVVAHNQGVANKIYISKAGKLARYSDGEPIDIPEPYLRQTWELLGKVVADVSNAIVAKAV